MAEASVVIPCYNQAGYLSSALHSVQEQTFQGWEAIVVDDGSTDDTAGVVARFTDARIRYVYQENRGLSAARNAGIRAARGEYLAFLDADDEWEPEFLERCLEVLRLDKELAGVYTQSRFIDETGSILPQVGGELVPRSAFRNRIVEVGFFPPNAVLIHADVLHHVGVFDTLLTSLEDWDLWIRIAEGHEMQGIPEPLARYRVRPGSMSTDAARMHANRMQVLAKHFGPPQGDVEWWPEEKRRAFGFAYRAAALEHIQQKSPEQGWRFLTLAVRAWPDLLAKLETMYELACGDQPRGYRGRPSSLDIQKNGAEMISRLNGLFAQAGLSLRPVRRAAYGNAYLALGLLSDLAAQPQAARGYLLRAIRTCPSLLVTSQLSRKLIKTYLGPRTVRAVRWLTATREKRTPCPPVESVGTANHPGA
jgi:hypothetical protein